MTITLKDLSQQLEDGINDYDIPEIQELLETFDSDFKELKQDFKELKKLTEILMTSSNITNEYLLDLVGRVADFKDCSKEIDAINDVKNTISEIQEIL